MADKKEEEVATAIKLPKKKSVSKSSPRFHVPLTPPTESKKSNKTKRLSLKFSKGKETSPRKGINVSIHKSKNRRSRSFRDLTERLSLSHKNEVKKEKPESSKSDLNIGPVISLNHVNHVKEEDANQFLTRLLKQREEKYAHIHHEIRNCRNSGNIYLKPSSTMVNEFRMIITSEEIKACNLEVDKNKYVKFWFELVPQSSKNNEEQNGSWIFSKPGVKSEKSSIPRWDKLEYFPANIFNIEPETHSERIRFMDDTKAETFDVSNSSIDYVLVFYISENQTEQNQIIGVIPLDDVKILSINTTEISISYINRIANTHYLKFPSYEETLEWIKVLELITQQEVKKVTKRLPLRSLQKLTGSVRDFKKFGNGSTSNLEKKKSYLPVYWDIETLHEDAFNCFSDSLQLTEYFDHNEEDEVQQGWRVLGGTIEDLVLWCLITSTKSNCENIDVSALFLSFSPSVILDCLITVLDLIKKQIKPQKMSKGMQFFLRKSPSESSVDKPDDTLQTKLFYMIEQWLKFLAIPVVNEKDESTEFCEGLIKFCSNRVKRDQLLILKGLNQQIQNRRINVPRTLTAAQLSPIWEGVTTTLSIFDISPTIIAEQLTLLEAPYHGNIRHSELLDLNFDKSPELSKNVTALTDHFNVVGLWVATQIIRQDSPKMQAKYVTRFLKIAKILFSIRNYNSCVEILSGISNVAISRLKKMQKFLDVKTINRYESLRNHFDPGCGYANYRSLSFELPCLHLYAVPIRTLTLIEEGNPRYLDDGNNVICFSKMTMVSECLAKLNLYNHLAWKYNFKVDPNIEHWLSQLRPLTDEQLYELSLKHEPLRSRSNLTTPLILPDKSTKYINPLFGREPLEKSGKLYSPDIVEPRDRRRSNKRKVKRRSSQILEKILHKS